MKLNKNRDDGLALVLVLIAGIAIAVAVSVVVTRVYAVKRSTDVAVARVALDEACKAAIDIGVEQFWNDYIVDEGGTPGNLSSYIAFIESTVPNNEDLNGNGSQDAGEDDLNGDGSFDINAPLTLIGGVTPPYHLQGGTDITSLTVARTDDLTGTTLTFQAVADASGVQRQATQTVRVSGQLFQGFEYGILANNVNCILCHADIRSLPLESNNDPGSFGTFDRVKVGTLETLQISTFGGSFAASSDIAGSIYTRGSVVDYNNNPMSGAQLASSTVKSFSLDTDGNIVQDTTTGAMTQTSLANAGVDGEGNLLANENLYLNYPTDPDLMTDGNLPTSFPSPYPDANGDRIVNDGEFQPFVDSSTGSITGGIAYGVPDGSTYGDSGLPTTSNSALANLANGTYDGNLVLTGTTADPIELNGMVTIDGDLVIAGNVKGFGQLRVRGNIYVVGDVTYADAPGEFGVASDGTVNGLAVTAGGSILMGDYITRSAKERSGGFFSQNFIDFRDDYKTVSGKQVGYLDDGVVDSGFDDAGEGWMSFTSVELAMFNKLELDKATADPNYTPRVYQLRDGAPVYEKLGNNITDKHYANSSFDVISDTSGMVVQSLSPNNTWITEYQLREIWFADEMSRPSSGRPFQFDGLLYTNNAIFGLVRDNQFHKSNTDGQMTIRGSIIAPDIGLLIPGAALTTTKDALKLWYDPRVQSFLQIEDTSQVEFSRTVYTASVVY